MKAENRALRAVVDGATDIHLSIKGSLDGHEVVTLADALASLPLSLSNKLDVTISVEDKN